MLRASASPNVTVLIGGETLVVPEFIRFGGEGGHLAICSSQPTFRAPSRKSQVSPSTGIAQQPPKAEPVVMPGHLSMEARSFPASPGV